MRTYTLGSLLQKSRKRKRLRQIDLSLQTGIPRERISHIENNRRPPNNDEWTTLARALGLPRAYKRLPKPFPSHRWRADTLRLASKGERSAEVRRQAAARTFGGAAIDRLVEGMNRRADAAVCHRFLEAARLESGLEYVFWARLLEEGAKPVWFAPSRAGFRRLMVIDSESLLNVSDLRHPCLEIASDGWSALLFPQLTVDARKARFRLDGLVGLDGPGGRSWLNIEVDGPGHDEEYDLRRSRLLEMEAIRLRPSDLSASDLTQRLWNHLRSVALPLPRVD